MNLQNSTLPPPPTLAFKDSKYRIAELLLHTYGGVNYKLGIEDLATWCKLKEKRTISYWLSIEAGDDKGISNLVIRSVLTFFNLQDECQLYTNTHNELLKLK